MRLSFVRRPFTAVAVGFCLVVADWQTPWLPSMLGWTLACLGLARVARRLPVFAPAAVAALVAGLLLTRLYPLTLASGHLFPAYVTAQAVAICATAGAILFHGWRTSDQTTKHVFSIVMNTLLIGEAAYLTGQVLIGRAASARSWDAVARTFHNVAYPARAAQLAATVGFCVALLGCRKRLAHLGQR